MVSVDHFYLESLNAFHSMDVTTSFLAGLGVHLTSTDAFVCVFKSIWPGQFWLPLYIKADGTYFDEPFKASLAIFDI